MDRLETGQSIERVAQLEMEELSFAEFIQSPSSCETLELLGHGTTDMTIETIHVIFTKIAVYFGQEIKKHLQAFNGLPVSELLKDGSDFFPKLIEAPVSKLIKIFLVKGQLGSQYASTIETSIRERLVYDDKYEEDEEIALATVSEFFQFKKLDPNSTIIYSWPPSNSQVEIFVHEEGSTASTDLGSDRSLIVSNKNVATSILEWMLGENSMTPLTVESVAQSVGGAFSY